MLYRIYTENTPEYRSTVVDLASQRYKGFTVLNAQGFWNGIGEQSLVLEIVEDADNVDVILALAHEIKHANGQQAVLVTWHEISTVLV